MYNSVVTQYCKTVVPEHLSMWSLKKKECPVWSTYLRISKMWPETYLSSHCCIWNVLHTWRDNTFEENKKRKVRLWWYLQFCVTDKSFFFYHFLLCSPFLFILLIISKDPQFITRVNKSWRQKLVCCLTQTLRTTINVWLHSWMWVSGWI